MRKLNEREESIKRGYIDCLNGKKPALALRANGRWTPTTAGAIRQTRHILKKNF